MQVQRHCSNPYVQPSNISPRATTHRPTLESTRAGLTQCQHPMPCTPHAVARPLRRQEVPQATDHGVPDTAIENQPCVGCGFGASTSSHPSAWRRQCRWRTLVPVGQGSISLYPEWRQLKPRLVVVPACRPAPGAVGSSADKTWAGVRRPTLGTFPYPDRMSQLVSLETLRSASAWTVSNARWTSFRFCSSSSRVRLSPT